MTITREHYGPVTRFVMTAPVAVPGESFQANAEVSAYLVGDVLIDAGGRRFGPSLAEALAAHPPRRILLTHQHEDHVGGVGALRRAFGPIDVFAPATLVSLLEAGETVSDYREAYWGQPEPIPGLVAIGDGDVFDADTIRIRALSTPGHTPGHMSFIAETDEGLFGITGDLLVQVRSHLGFFESSAADQVRSLRRVAALGDALYILPGHGRARKGGAAVLMESADWLEAEAATIRAMAQQLGSEDPVAIARAIYGMPEPAEFATGGDFSAAALVRSVLSPATSHPVSRIDLRPDAFV